MGRMPQPLHQRHVAAAVEGLRAFVESLKQQRNEIERKIVETEEALRAMEKQSVPQGSSTRNPSAPRRKKGENLRLIKDSFASPDDAFTVNQLAAKLGIPASSIQNVLRKHDKAFQQGADGLWRSLEVSG